MPQLSLNTLNNSAALTMAAALLATLLWPTARACLLPAT